MHPSDDANNFNDDSKSISTNTVTAPFSFINPRTDTLLLLIINSTSAMFFIYIQALLSQYTDVLWIQMLGYLYRGSFMLGGWLILGETFVHWGQLMGLGLAMVGVGLYLELEFGREYRLSKEKELIGRGRKKRGEETMNQSSSIQSNSKNQSSLSISKTQQCQGPTRWTIGACLLIFFAGGFFLKLIGDVITVRNEQKLENTMSESDFLKESATASQFQHHHNVVSTVLLEKGAVFHADKQPSLVSRIFDRPTPMLVDAIPEIMTSVTNMWLHFNMNIINVDSQKNSSQGYQDGASTVGWSLSSFLDSPESDAKCSNFLRSARDGDARNVAKWI